VGYASRFRSAEPWPDPVGPADTAADADADPHRDRPA
jgi:hypothetical protein